MRRVLESGADAHGQELGGRVVRAMRRVLPVRVLHVRRGHAPLPVPGAAGRLPVAVPSDRSRGPSGRVPGRRRRCVHRPRADRARRAPRPAMRRAVRGHVLLRHRVRRLVDRALAHLVPGRRAQVGPRGHRRQLALLPPGRVDRPGRADCRSAGSGRNRGQVFLLFSVPMSHRVE